MPLKKHKNKPPIKIFNKKSLNIPRLLKYSTLRPAINSLTLPIETPNKPKGEINHRQTSTTKWARSPPN